MRQIFTILLVSAAILLFFSGTTSPLYNLSFTDGMVFEYVALGIQHGQIPYVDIFDHKGPFTYFINYLGLLLGGRYGILFLQWINISLVFWLCNRICFSLHFTRSFSLAFPLALFSLIQMIDAGGMTEEWSLLFISISVSILVKALCTTPNRIPYWQMAVIGLCVGLVALLRLNNVAPIFGMFILWFALEIKNKQYSYLVYACLFCLVGFCFPIVIACSWFYTKAGILGLKEFYYANIGFNLDYAQNAWPNTIPIWKLLPVHFFYLSVIVVSLLHCFRKQPQHRLLIMGLLFSVAMTLFTKGKSWFFHYQLILIPIIFISLSVMSYYRQWVALFLIMASGLFCLKYPLYELKVSLEDNQKTAQFQQDFAQVLQVIPEMERADSWNLNVNGNIDLFLQNKLFPRSRFCIPWHRTYTQRFREEEKDAFRHQTSRWVFVEENCLYDNADDADYLLQHYYRVASTHTSPEKVISIYRLND